MKRIVKHGLIEGVSFIITMTAISYWISGHNIFTALATGIAGGVLVAILNSLVLYKYGVPRYVLDAVAVDLDTDETIKFQTAANYTSQQEPLSGKLFLTNKRLIFKSHKHDKNIQEFSIELPDITAADKFKTLKLFENGLYIHTTPGVTYKFIVDRLNQWLLQFDGSEKALQQSV